MISSSFPLLFFFYSFWFFSSFGLRHSPLMISNSILGYLDTIDLVE